MFELLDRLPITDFLCKRKKHNILTDFLCSDTFRAASASHFNGSWTVLQSRCRGDVIFSMDIDSFYDIGEGYYFHKALYYLRFFFF